MGQTLDCFCKGIEFTQSHRPEEAIPHSYDKCEPGLKSSSMRNRRQKQLYFSFSRLRVSVLFTDRY